MEKDIHVFYYFIHEVNFIEEGYLSVIKNNKNLINKVLFSIPLLKKCINFYINDFRKECFYFLHKKQSYDSQLKLIKNEIQHKISSDDLDEILYTKIKVIITKYPKEFENVKLSSTYDKFLIEQRIKSLEDKI